MKWIIVVVICGLYVIFKKTFALYNLYLIKYLLC